MVDRPRLQNSIIYGGIAAFGLAVLVPDPTGTTFVFLSDPHARGNNCALLDRLVRHRVRRVDQWSS